MIVVCGDRNSSVVLHPTQTFASVWAFDNDGTLRWTYDTGGDTNGIAIVSDRVIIAGVSSTDDDSNVGNLWKLTTSGVFEAVTNIASGATLTALSMPADASTTIWTITSTDFYKTTFDFSTTTQFTTGITSSGSFAAISTSLAVMGATSKSVVFSSGTSATGLGNDKHGFAAYANGDYVYSNPSFTNGDIERRTPTITSVFNISNPFTSGQGRASVVDSSNNLFMFEGVIASGSATRIKKINNAGTVLNSGSHTDQFRGAGVSESDIVYCCGVRTSSKTFWKISSGATIAAVGDTGSEAKDIDAIDTDLPQKVTNPTPANAAIDVSISTSLSWDAAAGATSYNVYFAKDGDTLALVSEEQAGLTFTPASALANNQKYNWRIDSIGSTTTGDSWSFTTIAFTLGGPVAKKYKKRLVAVTNNKVFYEDKTDTPPIMTELVAARGEIDVTENLFMTNGFQRAFIVNRTNFKIADFASTKLTTAALTTAHVRGTELTQQNSGAKMVVEFINTAKTLVYVYVINGTVDTVNLITDPLGGSGSDFTPTATLSPTIPHWYDWTPWPTIGSDTFGTLPTEAAIVARYLGKMVLSGHIGFPQAIFMAKSGHPFDFNFDENNALSAIATGNGTFGEVGDIVTALAPFKDDLLIVGAVNTISVIRGDPAGGGVMNIWSDGTGIWGPRAWAFDSDNNFYFIGNDGLYQASIREIAANSPPRNISKLIDPTFIEDLALDTELHRVNMAYDKDRRGLIISVVVVATGVSTNFWFDLSIPLPDEGSPGGFFPEIIPAVCSPFSVIDYEASTPDQRALLLGCTDGYIRKYDSAAKSDNIGGSSTEAIDSDVLFGPVPISDNITEKGLLKTILAITSGGASGGSNTDSDSVTYEVYISNNAEKMVEFIEDGGAPSFAGTLSMVGRNPYIRKKASGAFMALRLRNNTLNQSWSIEKIIAGIKPAGMTRRQK